MGSFTSGVEVLAVEDHGPSGSARCPHCAAIGERTDDLRKKELAIVVRVRESCSEKKGSR